MRSESDRIAQLKIDTIRSKFNESGPYYTSYPTLGLWSSEFQHSQYRDALIDFLKGEGRDAPIHFYVHIPFCAKLCWYCLCNVKVTNNREKIQEFVGYLLKEIDLLRQLFEEHNITPNIKEIHLGGGTPSHLDNEQFKSLVDKLATIIDIKNLDEFAMEIDPRTTNHENLKFYASCGVKRISFGVQDFDAAVQKAINRVQPPELVDSLLSPEVRACFKGINFDLLYGLPLQTKDTFRNTVELVKQLKPTRITLLKYAHVPDVRKHMKLINESDLPPDEDFPLIFIETVENLIKHGYAWVGIDNFASPTDDLAKAVSSKKVWRNFNGFTPGRTNHQIGVGPTTTACFGKYYAQSQYDFESYFKSISQNQFPIYRGYVLSDDDRIRRDVIFQILCQQAVDFDAIDQKYKIDHTAYFSDELKVLKNGFSHDDLVEFSGNKLNITPTGRFLLRNVGKVFDTFHKGKEYKILGC